MYHGACIVIYIAHACEKGHVALYTRINQGVKRECFMYMYTYHEAAGLVSEAWLLGWLWVRPLPSGEHTLWIGITANTGLK